MSERLVCIDAPYFHAAVVVDERSTVVRAAPIINYMLGWSVERVFNYRPAHATDWRVYFWPPPNLREVMAKRNAELAALKTYCGLLEERAHPDDLK